jgi:hypothetical protein
MRTLASTTFLAALLGCALSATPALSQQAPASSHSAHEMPASGNPVIDEFRSANEKMHKDMGIALSGDADRDFAQSMIPHHQGAIDMARTLRSGNWPKRSSALRKAKSPNSRNGWPAIPNNAARLTGKGDALRRSAQIWCL